MATLEKRKYVDKETGKTTLRHKAKIRLKDFPYEEATFDRKSDAEEWAAKREYELRNRQFFGEQAYKTKTIRDLLQRYQESLKATNIKTAQEQLQEVLTRLGFKEVRYRWYREADEFTYYKLDTPPDGKLAYLQYGRFQDMAAGY